MATSKRGTSYRLSDRCREQMEQLSERFGVKLTDVLEIGVELFQEWARHPVPKDLGAELVRKKKRSAKP